MNRLCMMLLCLLLVCPVTALAQQGWYEQASGDSTGYYEIDMVTPEIGTIIGGARTILRTTNGGATWFPQTSGFGPQLHAVSFANPRRGIIVGAFGEVLRTTNGGDAWISAVSGTSEYLMGVAFADTNTAVAAGGGGTVIRTTNGGASWSPVTLGTYSFFYDVCFANARDGAMLSDNSSVYWTTDGGVTWVQRTITPYGWMTAMAIIDANTAVAASYMKILRTSDGGMTWTADTLEDFSGNITDISFGTPDTGFAVGEGGVVFRSTNGGRTWERSNVGRDVYLAGVDFVNGSVGNAVGEPGTIFRTTTGGRRLTLLEPNGGEVWNTSTVHEIRWSRTLVSRLQIDLSTDGGSTWALVADSVDAVASRYQWTLPATPSTTCRIRLRERGSGSIGDSSESNFLITLPPAITVVPDSLAVVVNEMDSAVVNLTISNGGPGILGFKVRTELITGTPTSGLVSMPALPPGVDAPAAPVGTNGNSGGMPAALNVLDPLPPGIDLEGERILLDGVHGWVDTTYYPWSAFSRDLKAAGASVSIMRTGVLNDDTLSNYDVLIVLQVGTVPRISELQAVQRFVNRGGGLFVLTSYDFTLFTYWTYFAGIEAINSSWAQIPEWITDISLHPVTTMVDTLTGGWSVGGSLVLVDPAVSLVRMVDSTIMAASTYGAGTVVALPTTGLIDYYASVDNRQLVLNAVSWAARTATWVVPAPRAGLLAAGGSRTVKLTVRAAEVGAGTSLVSVNILSNDPDSPEIVVPLSVRVVGVPLIAVSADTLDFGEVFLTQAAALQLMVTNRGSDTLTVSGITISNPAFSLLGPSAFTLLPRRSRVMAVVFNPAAIGLAAGDLTIQSNDLQHPVRTVALRGLGLGMPIVTVTPDSLNYTLPLGGTDVRQLTVRNTGEGTLKFIISTEFLSTTGGFVLGPAGAGVRGPAWTDGMEDARTAAADTVRIVAVRGFATSEASVTTKWDYLNAEYRSFGTRPIRIDYSLLRSGEITLSRLRQTDADVLVIVNAYRPEASYGYYSTAEMEAIDQYLAEGHGLIVTSGSLNTAYVPRHNRLAPMLGLDPGATYRYYDGLNWTYGYFSNLVPAVHPVFTNVPSPYWPLYTQTVVPVGGWRKAIRGGMLIASSNPEDSAAVVAYRNRVYFSYYADLGMSSGENQVLYNAMVWCGTTVPWLTESVLEDTVAPGGTRVVDFTAAATGLACGSAYDAVVRIETNDPYNPLLYVPARLSVTGAPNIVLSTDTLLFEESFVGYADTLGVSIKNTGCDSLRVLGISIDNPLFTPLTTSGVIATGQSLGIPVRFAPTAKGSVTANLTVSSSDPAHPAVVVRLIGRVFDPPSIALSHTAMRFSLHGGDSVTVPMTIRNGGPGVLRFAIGEEVTGTGASELVGDTVSSSAGGINRIQGNIYGITGGVWLRSFSAYLEVVASTEARFVVYEGSTAEGPYSKVWEGPAVYLWPWKGFFGSGPIGVLLGGGKYYLLGVAHQGTLNVFRESATLPMPTSFGEVRYAASVTTYPPPASVFAIRSTTLVWTQRLDTGYPLLASADPDSGTVAPGDSAIVQMRVKAPPQPGRHTSLAMVYSNDPARRSVSVGLTVDVLTGVAGETGNVPAEFALEQNYPNPFNPTTVISCQWPVASNVKLVVYDMLGREVAVLVDGVQPAGRYSVTFDAKNLATGTYVYRLTAGPNVATRKMLVIK